jgi:DMSO/TMAO reductase YedYZ molybdopterin-dependent catalytic subunit
MTQRDQAGAGSSTPAGAVEPVDPVDPGGTGAPVGRRLVLAMLGLGAAGVLVGKSVQGAITAAASHDPTGLTSLLPGNEGFRYYSVVESDPRVAASQYRLQVGGLVDRPATLTFADLQALPQTHLTKDFQCVTGWRVPGVHWSGVALPDLLEHVGAHSSAAAVLFTSLDGVYTESLTMDQAMRRDVLVATAMVGDTVTPEHGGPVRLYVAPMYGYKSCKWLGGIQVADHVQPGYWEELGYDVDAWVGRSNGRTDAPTS